MKKYSSRYISSGHPFCAHCKCWISAARQLFCFSPLQRNRFGGVALCDLCETSANVCIGHPQHFPAVAMQSEYGPS